jgi:hypothetical protein
MTRALAPGSSSSTASWRTVGSGIRRFTGTAGRAVARDPKSAAKVRRTRTIVGAGGGSAARPATRFVVGG